MFENPAPEGMCGSRKYPYPTTEGMENSGGVGGGVKSPGKSRGEGGGEQIHYFPEGQLRFIPM